MTNHFTFRAATEQDRTYIHRLFYLTDVYGDESKPVSSLFGKLSQGYVSDWSPENDGGVIALEPEGVPAGGVWLRHWANKDAVGFANLDPNIPELAIAVEPRNIHRGLGVKLLIAACELAKTQGCEFIALHVDHENLRAVKIYKRFGFTVVGTDPADTGVIMTLRLN
ncbi:ribosomal protein S18 acetylase RimI-like enzyme [Arcanobacterium pluranimalium]|uniref:GNAT family N-acetyltransferase n=1 Tax=Arcanobacterium pluranimalium TaxID=108028 RepID=UPI00195B9369|nr:GNAT family N-acetyltransferase [Arcanobacterium pluranimalium]MBM7824337.1 ribosomal protein S18 acetylase RimI-like enzyme [Arcanobacterium pluranimalium]